MLGACGADDLAADQLVGRLPTSAADLLRQGNSNTLAFYLDAGLDGLRCAGEQLDAFVGSMAAFFVGLTDNVAHSFPPEHRNEVIPWLEAFGDACVGGSVRIWGRQEAATQM